MSTNQNSTDNIVKTLIGASREYVTVYPQNFKKGHGGSLSVKIVLPCYCQAHCSFCFNNLTSETQKHDYEQFFDNLPKTLEMIFNNIGDRPITLDITGNEPTFDIKVFSKFMSIIEKYKFKADKIVLTTNGYNLEKCLIDMAGIVDVVNISVHHYDYINRQSIFCTPYIPDDVSLKRIIEILKNNGTTCTAVAVLYNKIENFEDFYNNFISWAINLGFKDVRMRSNFCSTDEFINDILDIKMKNERMNSVGGLTTKIIVDENTGFETYILKGVPDLTKYVVGAELVVDDDGYCYIDYNKRYPVNNSNINYFNNLYIFNNDSDKSKDWKEVKGPVLNKIRK
ncbi:MAG: radical SAM protein [Bacilli bacterium]|nr:radical SAM protein [Bacilli bacterium]